jgi:hypothetical protein
MPRKPPKRLFRRPTSGPAYLPVMLDHLEKLPPVPGQFTELATLHDDWCGIWEGRDCDCDPIVMRMEEYRRRQTERN